MRIDLTVNEDLDQNTDFFDNPVPQDPGAELWVNLQKVNMINSTGIRKWMQWTRALPAGMSVHMTFVPNNMAVQASLIEGFFPENVSIESVRTYFFCDRDSKDSTVLMQKGKDYFYASDTVSKKPEVRLPSVLCPKCGKPMEPDFLESRVFAFLKNI